MVMLHPNVATIDPTSATATKSVLGPDADEIETLGTYIASCRARARTSPRSCRPPNPDGSPSQPDHRLDNNVTR